MATGLRGHVGSWLRGYAVTGTHSHVATYVGTYMVTWLRGSVPTRGYMKPRSRATVSTEERK